MGSERHGTAITLDAATAAHWRAGAGLAFALSRASRAYRLVLATLAARGQAAPTIWVPAYFCGDALFDIRQTPARLVFYQVTDALAPDWEECARLARDHPLDLFVLPHLFGAVAPAAEARRFAEAQGGLLFEDAVHVLLPVEEIGRHGHFVTYSPRKFFDAPDGGLLVVPDPELAATALAAAASLPKARSSTLRWRLERLRRPGRRHRGPLPPLSMDDEADNAMAGGPLWMSAVTRHRLHRAAGSDGFAAIATPRLAAQREAEIALSGWNGLRPLPMDSAAVPYFHAMRAPDPATAQKALDALRAAGALVAPWPAMPAEVRADPARYASAWQIRRTLLRFSPQQERHRHPADFLAHPDAPWRTAAG